MRSWPAAIVLGIVIGVARLAAANPSDTICHTLGKHRVEIDVGVWGEDGHLVGFGLTPPGRSEILVDVKTVMGFWYDADQILLRAHDTAEDRDTVLFKYDTRRARGTI